MEPSGRTRELRVYGPTSVRCDGVEQPLRRRELQVLTALALKHPQPVSVLGIVDILWASDPPRTALEAVQNHIGRLRHSLGASAIVTEPAGYRLGSDWTLDITVFDTAISRAEHAVRGGDHRVVRAQLSRALALVRGEPFAELDDYGALNVERVARRERCLAAEEQLSMAQLEAGEITTAVARATALVASEPFRELRWCVLSLGLYRDGQRRESLASLQRAGRQLRNEAGLEPGALMRTLEQRILRDDPSLATEQVWSLLERGEPSRRSDSGGSFVGRLETLDQIQQILLAVADDGKARAVHIIGGPGVGKTAMLEQVSLRAAIDGFDVATAVCRAVPSELLEPWGELVRTLLSFEPNSPEKRAPKVLRSANDAPRSQQHLSVPHEDVDAMIGLITAHAHLRPTLLVIDDVHHLSPSGHRFLGALATAVAPILLLTASHSPLGTEGIPNSEIELQGLDRTETKAFLESVLKTAVDTTSVEISHIATGGNPHRIRQLHDLGTGSASRSPTELVRVALDRLGPVVEQIAVILAMAGGPLQRSLLLRAIPNLDINALDEGVAAGQHAGLFRSDRDGRIRLGQSDLRAVLLSSINHKEQADLHVLLAICLIDAGLNVAAAAHIMAVPSRFAGAEIDLLASTAASAAQATLFIESAEYFGGAAALSEVHHGVAHRRTLQLLLDQAEQLRRAGDPSSVLLVWSVVRRAEDARDHEYFALGAAALCRLGPLIRSGSLDQDVAAVVERALSLPLSVQTRSACAGNATLFYSMSGKIDRCRELFDVALTDARASNDDGAILAALGNVYVALSHPSDWKLRGELGAEMMGLAEQLNDDDGRFEALHNYFSVQLMFADPLLRTTFAQQMNLSYKLRSFGRRWMADYQRACIAYLDGRLEESEEISDANAKRSPMDPSRTLSTHLMHVLVVRLAQGRGEELAADLDEAIANQPGVPGWRAVAAWLAALRGDFDRVAKECDLLQGGDALPKDMAWNGAVMLLGRAVATTGDTARCRALSELLAPWTGLMTWYGSGTVGPIDLALAELALAVGDRPSARTHAGAARAIVTRLRAVVFFPDLDRLDDRLR
jgi:DNA-binding SARP family transcriptional activator